MSEQSKALVKHVKDASGGSSDAVGEPVPSCASSYLKTPQRPTLIKPTGSHDNPTAGCSSVSTESSNSGAFASQEVSAAERKRENDRRRAAGRRKRKGVRQMHRNLKKKHQQALNKIGPKFNTSNRN